VRGAGRQAGWVRGKVSLAMNYALFHHSVTLI
jgi:hypothetical protein